MHRALLQYFGGKWLLAPWVLRHLAPHRVYVEPFGGAASVLLRKPRAAREVYNDLDGDVVNLFRVVQNPQSCQQLFRLLRRTPYARSELERARQPAVCPIIRAQRLVVRSLQDMRPDSMGGLRRGLSFDSRSHYQRSRNWASYPRVLAAICRRLRGVAIESMCALELMRRTDGPQVLFFVDPPYLPATRVHGRYRHELTAQQHEQLLHALLALQGMVVLCGYPSALYDERLCGWHRVQREHSFGVNHGKRCEVLWLNTQAWAALQSSAPPESNPPESNPTDPARD